MACYASTACRRTALGTAWEESAFALLAVLSNRSFARRIEPAALGYPLTAFIVVTVTQRKLASIADKLAGVILDIDGVEKTTTGLVMRR